MIGPTGVGKTEIARRLADLTDSPFIKVEATKFTTVGYQGRDVDTIIKELVNATHSKMRKKIEELYDQTIREKAEEKILDILTQADEISGKNVFTREIYRGLIRSGEWTNKIIGDENGEERKTIGNTMDELVEIIKEDFPPENMEHLIKKETIRAVEENGIVFIDEIDKICLSESVHRQGVEVSSEGVQRDLIPLLEGMSVATRIGQVNTHKILFITSGAFHMCKPSDMLAELQGRLPIRVEMKPLTREDMLRILREPEYNLIRQQIELMKAEGITLQFTEDAVRELASLTTEINTFIENTGARRLHSVIEKVTEDLSYECEPKGGEVLIDADFIKKKVQPFLERADLKRNLI